MKVASAIAPALRLPRVSREIVAHPYRLAGLLLAVVVPVLFWTAALLLVASVFDIAIGPVGLAAVAIVSGLSCLLGAAAAMAGRS